MRVTYSYEQLEIATLPDLEFPVSNDLYQQHKYVPSESKGYYGSQCTETFSNDLYQQHKYVPSESKDYYGSQCTETFNRLNMQYRSINC
jgi:hypothetical protein